MKTSSNLIAATTTAGNRNLRIQNALAGLDLSPYFKMENIETGSNSRLNIVPRYTLSGDGILRVPFGIVEGTRITNGVNHFLVQNNWKVDLTTTTINLASHSGGRVDGGVLTNNWDYLIWAFFDPNDSVNNIFRGFGMTRRPWVTGATVTGTITMGTSGTITTGAGGCRQFVVGARVIVRVSSTAGSVYNQGTITAKTEASITILADASYGIAFESNANLTGTVEIIQLNKFEPLMATSLSLYPGGGVEYAFKYMGSVHTDGSGRLRDWRYRGDWYYFPAELLVTNTVVGALTDLNTCLSRWIGRHAQWARFRINGNVELGVGTDGYCAVGPSTALPNNIITEINNSEPCYTAGTSDIFKQKNSINFRIQPATATNVRGVNYLFAYNETEF